MGTRFYLPIIFAFTLCSLLCGIVKIHATDDHVVLYTSNDDIYNADDYWQPPRRFLKRIPSPRPVQQGGVRPAIRQTYHVVSRGVLNLRSLIGGGRKIIRHDWQGGTGDNALSVIFTKDVDPGQSQLFHGLSTDEGETWNIIGPLSDPDLVGNDRDHNISFCKNLTYLAYVDWGFPFDDYLCYFSHQLFEGVQAFSPFTLVSEALGLNEMALQQVMTEADDTDCAVYWSFIGTDTLSTGTVYFRKSTDRGQTWSDYLDIDETIGASGFEMAGLDGPLMMDADEQFIAALAFVILDNTWAGVNGFLGGVAYPAYTQSTDGGMSWDDLRLIFGNDGSAYPQGHSGDPVFDSGIHYIGGVQDAGYTAFNNCQDNTAITPDGLAHLTFTMNDTTYGYTGIWHTAVDDGVMTSEYVGFPENPNLEGESGVAFMPSIATMDEGPAAGGVVTGWTEFMQGTGGGAGDICMNAIPPGSAVGTAPVNVTQSTDDETYQRIVDKIAFAEPVDYFVDWLFLYYGEGGSAADSTLWHLQTIITFFIGIDDDQKTGKMPGAVDLLQNYPNPFNPATTISFDIPGGEGEKRDVILTVYDIRGRLVKTLLDEDLEPGKHQIVWDGRNGKGQPVSSGIYLYTLRTGDKTYTRKMVVLE